MPHSSWRTLVRQASLVGQTSQRYREFSRLLLSPFEFRQGRDGRRALGAGQAGVRPHVRLVVLVRPDRPGQMAGTLLMGKAAIGATRSRRQALPSLRTLGDR